MNLCKSRGGGGISARTKSLREKFSSKRSYSELTFKDSTTSLTETTDLSSPGSSFRSKNPPQSLNFGKLASAETIRVSLPKNDFNAYNLLPEEAYCSALDINCSDSEPRFPWQRDVAIQCDLDDNYKRNHSPGPKISLDNSKKSKTSTSSAGSASSNENTGSGKKHSGLSTLTSNLRFWKSSSPLNSGGGGEIEKKPSTRKRLTRSVLHRAASFDSKGYSRLIQQASIDSQAATPSSTNHLYVPSSQPSAIGLVDTSPTSGQPQSSAGTEDEDEATREIRYTFGGVIQTSSTSAPQSRASSPPNGTSEVDGRKGYLGKILATAGSKRHNFHHKQISSAPDSFEDSSPTDEIALNFDDVSGRTRNNSGSRGFNVDTIQKLFDLKMKGGTSQSTGDVSIDKPFLLSVPCSNISTGLNVGKDVTNYMNLPSPNVHAEGQESNPVFKKFAGLGSHGEESEQEESLQEEPPASALHRRRALVPPKLITDGYESSNEDAEPARESSPISNHLLSEPASNKTRRRSSIVVIPPMQICPGDLLVYSKVLTHRNDLLDSFVGSTQCLAVAEDASRKGKNTWSLLKLFDRSNRTKADSLCGLEEVLSTLTPSVFIDEQLSKYKGMTWSDFEAQFEERRASSIISGHRLSQLQSDSRRSSGQSSITAQSNNTTLTSSHSPTKSPRRPVLLRTQTFDSAQSNSSDDSLSAANAHSIRSNSCIAPVSTSIRRLSGGFDLKEESLDEGQNESLSSLMANQAPTGVSENDAAADADQADPGSPPGLLSSPTSSRSSFAITRSEYKRREALWDLFQSECVFLYCHLMVLKNVFMEPLKKIQVEGFAMFAEPEVLFGNLDELCCVTYAFCKEFLSLILHQMNQGDLNPAEVLVKLFQKVSSNTKPANDKTSSKATALTQAYHRYTLNYINALNYLETLRRQVEFNEFEKWCSRDPRCKKLQLTDLLVSPVQHIMRVPLILKDIETRTEDSTERELIAQIIEAEEASLRELDDKMKWLKNFERLLEIQRNIVWPSVFDLDSKVFIPECLKAPLSKQPCERLIVSPRRQIIIEGSLNVLDSGKPVEMYVVLFDDMLLITRRKKGLHKKQSSFTEKWASTCSRGSTSSMPHESPFKYVVYKQPLSLDRFYIHDITASEGAAHNLKYVFVLVCLNRFQQIVTIHTFQAPNEIIKINWLSKLRDTADRWKRTLQNTVFRNQQRLSSASVSTTASYRETSTCSR